MTSENINLSESYNDDNVLKYIYQLQKHLDYLTLVWQGNRITSNGKLMRVSEPFACDDFIFQQINTLSSVLSSHNFVSNVEISERNNIILDTYASFLYSMNREPTIKKHHKPMMRESFYNTMLLFLNILQGGAGAQFTLGAQSGVTTKIYNDQNNMPVKPILDIAGAFGFKKNNPTQQQYTQQKYDNRQQEGGFEE